MFNSCSFLDFPKHPIVLTSSQWKNPSPLPVWGATSPCPGAPFNFWDLSWFLFSLEKASNRLLKKIRWLLVSTHLKNISQIRNLPQIGVKIKNLWNHQEVHILSSNEVDEDEAIACYCGPLWLFGAFPSTPFPIAGISSATHSSGHMMHVCFCLR